MSEIYPYADLTQGTNIVEWMLIINGWSGGLIFTSLIIGICILIFGIMITKDIDMDICLISAGFLGFLISGTAWLIRWNGLELVPTSIPIFLILVCATGIIMRMVRNWI